MKHYFFIFSFCKIESNNIENLKVYYKQSDGVYKELTAVKSTSAELNNIKSGRAYSLMIMAFYSDGTYKDVDIRMFTLKA